MGRVDDINNEALKLSMRGLACITAKVISRTRSCIASELASLLTFTRSFHTP